MRGTVVAQLQRRTTWAGTARNWRVHLTHMRVIDQATLSMRVFGPPRSLGDGNWCVLSKQLGTLFL